MQSPGHCILWHYSTLQPNDTISLLPYTTYSSIHLFSKGHSCSNTSVQCCIHGGGASSCVAVYIIFSMLPPHRALLPLRWGPSCPSSPRRLWRGVLGRVAMGPSALCTSRGRSLLWRGSVMCTSYRVACDIRIGDLWHVTLVRMWNTYVMQPVTHVQYVYVECATLTDQPHPCMQTTQVYIHIHAHITHPTPHAWQ